jgi:hypothetical protein
MRRSIRRSFRRSASAQITGDHIAAEGCLVGRPDQAPFVPRPDENDAVEFDKLLWSDIAGRDVAYPATRSGLDLSLDRHALLRTDKPPVGDD